MDNTKRSTYFNVLFKYYHTYACVEWVGYSLYIIKHEQKHREDNLAGSHNKYSKS